MSQDHIVIKEEMIAEEKDEPENDTQPVEPETPKQSVQPAQFVDVNTVDKKTILPRQKSKDKNASNDGNNTKRNHKIVKFYVSLF